jgi:hypothetical protein
MRTVNQFKLSIFLMVGGFFSFVIVDKKPKVVNTYLVTYREGENFKDTIKTSGQPLEWSEHGHCINFRTIDGRIIRNLCDIYKAELITSDTLN